MPSCASRWSWALCLRFFDLATFWVLLQLFHAGPELFRTSWFIESMVTRILVIFVIRTWGTAWSSHANGALVATSLGALAVACIIALSLIGRAFGFAAVPAFLLLSIGIIVVVHLCLAEVIKSRAQRRLR